MYRLFKHDPDKALKGYIAGLRLGGSKPLPEVWSTMGIDFDFSTGTLKDLVNFVQEELNDLKED
jgi:oligoendopeptidase F